VCLFTIPYGLILPVAVCWLAIRHYQADAPSDRSRAAVALLTAVATALMFMWGHASVPAALVLVAIGVYVILHREITNRPSV
jgi:hypothetical protein